MFSPSRSHSLVSIASSGLSSSDEDFNLDPILMPSDASIHIVYPTVSEPVEDARDFAQIKTTREDWEKLQALEQRLRVPSSACSAPAAIEKHARFFLPTENIFFLVSNTLYSVPRAPFKRHSSAFTGKGLTEDDSFILADVEVAHFDHFLSILYPSEYGMYTATTVDEWTAILHLAVRWGFGSIRTLSIKHLAPIATDIEKIVLGRQYAIDEWLANAYFAVCMREQSLTEEEGTRLKVADIIKISSIRQRFGLGLRPPVVLPLAIGDVRTSFDLSQFVSLPTGSERAAPGPVIAGDADVIPSSEQHAISPTDFGEEQSGLGLDPILNQSDLTPSTTGIDTTVPLEPTPSEEAGSAERAREAGALERAERAKDIEITERALRTFFLPSSNALLANAPNGEDRQSLRAVAKVLRAELTNTIAPRKQQVLDFIATYEAEASSAGKARAVAPLKWAERDTETTGRALSTFILPSKNALLASVGKADGNMLRAVAAVLRAELTHTVDPRKQQILDFITNYKAANHA